MKFTSDIILQVEIAGFNLTVLPCQAGFVLKRQSNGLVQCDCSYGSHFWFGNQIISCNKDTEEIILMVYILDDYMICTKF